MAAAEVGSEVHVVTIINGEETTVEVYASYDEAYDRKVRYARENWDDHRFGEPMPQDDEDLLDVYYFQGNVEVWINSETVMGGQS